MFWPIWIALTSAGMAVTWFTDRTAFYGFLTVLCGLVAMRLAVHLPFFLGPITVWTTVAAIHYSTKQSIAACILAAIVPLPYIFAFFGAPWLHAARVSDVAGVLLLVSLMAPTVANWIGTVRAWVKRAQPRPLPSWCRGAVQARGKAQESATPEAMRQDLP